MKKWKIYYADGTTFDSSQGDPEDSPKPAFVICIVQPHPDVGRQVMHGWSNYFYDRPTGRWWGANEWGVKEQFMYRPREVTALQSGYNVRSEDYKRIFNLAVTDPEFPIKNARNNEESPTY